ncbi:MAG: YiiG family protein [Alphaproteobacteria bacterium]|nr:YiiG family protein [Alphaproteobacteria bacterium]
MKQISAALLACSLLLAIASQAAVRPLLAQEQSGGEDEARQRALSSKIDAYIRCLNSYSSTIYESRERYFKWAARSGPTGKESHIYGPYAFGTSSACREPVELANEVAPHLSQLESAAHAYVSTVTRLVPLVKEASAYYENDNYKDDNMARGRALHPALVAAFDEFFSADQQLRNLLDPVSDGRARQELTAIETSGGRKLDFEVAALLVDGKTLVNAIRAAPDEARITAALSQYETSLGTVTSLDEAARNSGGDGVRSPLLMHAGNFLASAKIFLRRLRDKTPYRDTDQAALRNGFYSRGWMVKGSPADLALSYNGMIETYNSNTITQTLQWIPLAPADGGR